MVLICISLIIRDDEHFFTFIGLICLLLKIACSYPSPTFGWVCLFFSHKSVLVLCRFEILAFCQMGRLQKFDSHSVVCCFTLMTVSFSVQSSGA